MRVTACLAGQDGVDVEVGEECRSLQALKEAIVEALPQLCVEGFDVSVSGRALDDDEGVVALQDGLSLDVVPNTRGLSVRALREAGREVNERGLLEAAEEGDVSVVTLYLDAGVPIDCVGGDESDDDETSVEAASDEEDRSGWTPLHYACEKGRLELATVLLDRGSTALEETEGSSSPLDVAFKYEHWKLWHFLMGRLEARRCPAEATLVRSAPAPACAKRRRVGGSSPAFSACSPSSDRRLLQLQRL